MLEYWLEFLGLDKPSEYHLVRNHLQKITHPHLIIRGHGDFYIEFTDEARQIVQYYKYRFLYDRELEILKKDKYLKVIRYGCIPYNQWKNWNFK